MSANSSFDDCVEVTDDMENKEGQEGGETDEGDVNGNKVHGEDEPLEEDSVAKEKSVNLEENKVKNKKSTEKNDENLEEVEDEGLIATEDNEEEAALVVREVRGRKKMTYGGWLEVDGGKMQCEVCLGTRGPVDRKNMNQHNRIYHLPPSFQCQNCGKVSLIHSSLLKED